MVGGPRRFQNPSYVAYCRTTRPSPEGPHSAAVLTCVWLVAVVSLTEVLGVLNDRDARHADHHRVRPGVQGRGRGDAVVDVVQRAGRVLLAADDGHGTCTPGDTRPS